MEGRRSRGLRSRYREVKRRQWFRSVVVRSSGGWRKEELRGELEKRGEGGL